MCSLAVFVGSLCIFGVLWGSTACSDFMFAIKVLLINDDSFWGSLGQTMILRLCRSAVRFQVFDSLFRSRSFAIKLFLTNDDSEALWLRGQIPGF